MSYGYQVKFGTVSQVAVAASGAAPPASSVPVLAFYHMQMRKKR